MKDKILVFLIGLLLGAVLTSAGFLIYEKNNTSNTQNNEQTQMMERPEGGMPNGERPDGETPPEKPDGENGNGTRPEPPSKDNKSSNNNSTSKNNNQ